MKPPLHVARRSGHFLNGTLRHRLLTRIREAIFSHFQLSSALFPRPFASSLTRAWRVGTGFGRRHGGLSSPSEDPGSIAWLTNLPYRGTLFLRRSQFIHTRSRLDHGQLTLTDMPSQCRLLSVRPSYVYCGLLYTPSSRLDTVKPTGHIHVACRGCSPIANWPVARQSCFGGADIQAIWERKTRLTMSLSKWLSTGLASPQPSQLHIQIHDYCSLVFPPISL